MNTIIKLNGKKISKKAAVEMFGQERMENRIKEAIEYYYEEGGADNSSTWMDGMEIVVFEG